MKKERMTAKELTEELAEGYPKDIFYSDLFQHFKAAHLCTDTQFIEIVRALEAKGIWVHS